MKYASAYSLRISSSSPNHCRALCKISKRLGNQQMSCGHTNFRFAVYRCFRRISYITRPSYIRYDLIRGLSLSCTYYSGHAKTVSNNENVMLSLINHDRFHVTWNQREKIVPGMTRGTHSRKRRKGLFLQLGKLFEKIAQFALAFRWILAIQHSKTDKYRPMW